MQLKKKLIGRSLLAFLAIAIALPSMAHTRTPSIAHPPTFDRYAVVDDDQQDERELVVIDRPTLRQFESVSRVELPAEPIASQLETRIRSITLTADHAPIDVFPVSQKLASGSLEVFEENNLNEHRELGLKTWWALGNVRARWYDPSTGTFLSPDPMGYQDSSNLYAYCGGDPVNCSDPTGEAGFWKDAGKTLWGYTKGVTDVVLAPAALTYNLTGALLHETTGGKQYQKQHEASVRMAATVSALRTRGDVGRFLVQGFQAAVDQAAECAKSGDAECTGEAVGSFVAQALTLGEAASTTNITIAPARQLATAGAGATIRAGSTAIAVTGPRVGLVLLSSAANGGSRGGVEPTRIGQVGEQVGTEVSGLPKNTRRIPSASGKRAYRVPDHMDDAQRRIQEDKATKKQHLSSQLLDNKAHVLRDFGAGIVEVLVDELTEITMPLLREHLNPGSPIKVRTGKLKKP